MLGKSAAELIFPTSKVEEKGENNQREEDHFGPGVTLNRQRGGHRATSRYRVDRAFWTLMIYWNVRSIEPALEETYDYDYADYVGLISQDLKPQRSSVDPSIEVAYMNCVSSTIQGALGDSSLDSIFTSSDNYYNSQVERAWPLSAIVLKVIAQWKLDNSVPVPSHDLENWRRGPERQCLSEYNSEFRQSYWFSWHFTIYFLPLGAKLKLNHRDMDFPDYLGFCLWDRKRLAYLGLQPQCETGIDFKLGLPKKPSPKKAFSSNSMNERWRELLLHGLVRLPGGREYTISDDCPRL